MSESTEITAAGLPILVEFPDRHGLVEASLGWPNREKLEELAAHSQAALNRAMETIAEMAQRAAALRDQIPHEFTKAEISFGVKLDYEAGALLAKAGAEGSIAVTLTWERKKEKENE
jgi:hypothetical protein